MCFEKKHEQITEYPLYLHEDEKGNTEIIGRRGRKVRRVEMGGGMPEGGEPYQQLVTDGEGKTVWEDRLGYKTDPVETVLLDEPNLAFEATEQVSYANLNPGTLQLTVGNVYKVVWNGQSYDCTCKNHEPNPGYGITFFGNGMILGLEDSGEPFFIASVNGQEGIYDYAAATANSVRILAFTQETIPVPSDLLPVATDDAYGVVKKTEVIERYHFPSYEAPVNEMREAIAKFREGKGIISWVGYMVVSAYDSGVDGIIYLMFSGDTFLRKYSVHGDGGNERYIETIWELTDPVSLYLPTSDGVYALYIDDDGNVKANKHINA